MKLKTEPAPCATCGGSGKVIDYDEYITEDEGHDCWCNEVECPACGGRGTA